jgi:tRNA threonylcarbamoyladenosine biosynthesis protein TsaE
MKEIIYSLNEVDAVAQRLKDEIADCDVVTFSGSLGAGKTTLIRALGKALGIAQEITSPTFAYVNLYDGSEHKRYAHFDLYRLHSPDDFIAMGLDDFLQDTQVFVEWPDVLEPLLKGKRVCRILIDYEGLDKRKLQLNKDIK